MLVAYYFMWSPGALAAEQCEGCTWVATRLGSLSDLHSRDITFAVLCQGPYDESVRYRDFMDWNVPWYSAHTTYTCSLLVGRHAGQFHRRVTCATAIRCSRPTGCTTAASRRWTTATR